MANSKMATTPEPPYFAVIFTSTRSDGDQGYAAMAEEMVALASQQPGFLGVDSVRGTDGLWITVSYWTSESDPGLEEEWGTPSGSQNRQGDVVRRLFRAHRQGRTSLRETAVPVIPTRGVLSGRPFQEAIGWDDGVNRVGGGNA